MQSVKEKFLLDLNLYFVLIYLFHYYFIISFFKKFLQEIIYLLLNAS